jgi:hypothetical protein
MTGPIETMGWEIVDATGSHRHIHGGEIDVTRTVLVGQDRAVVHIYATTAESHGETLAFMYFY